VSAPSLNERCSVTELFIDMCAHCRPAPAPDPFDEPAGPPRRWFAASYRGECSVCDETIEPGDEIRADGSGGYLCTDCGAA